MRRLSALSWPGGKSANGAGVGRWIAGQLPWRRRSTYIEPFAGMLGVLLQREPVRTEIANDSDGRVVNWWRVVRDRYSDLDRLLQLTPHARLELEAMKKLVDDPDPLKRALACSIVWTGSHPSGKWRRSFRSSRGPVYAHLDLTALANRLRRVQLECCDGVDLLERTATADSALIYVDPPYPSRKTNDLYAADVDVDRLADVLRAQSGCIGLSGYLTDPWDELGWVKRTFSTHSFLGTTAVPRTECLWLNPKLAREVSN